MFVQGPAVNVTALGPLTITIPDPPLSPGRFAPPPPAPPPELATPGVEVSLLLWFKIRKMPLSC